MPIDSTSELIIRMVASVPEGIRLLDMYFRSLTTSDWVRLTNTCTTLDHPVTAADFELKRYVYKSCLIDSETLEVDIYFLDTEEGEPVYIQSSDLPQLLNYMKWSTT